MTSTNVPFRKPSALILTGFDRSGTSVISKTLAQHAQVELFLQPFNSGPVRQKMNQFWNDDIADPEDVAFFKGLEDGRLIRPYIKSHWFAQSTAEDFVPGHLHVLKTTLNHMVTPWSAPRFAGLPHWAIWRAPKDILASLIRNDFIDKWFNEALKELLPTVQQSPWLQPVFGEFHDHLFQHRHIDAAYLIAVRSYVLFKNVPQAQVLSYERFCVDPAAECDRLYNTYGLDRLEVSAQRDGNIIGKPFARGESYDHLISGPQRDSIEALFSILSEFDPNLEDGPTV